MAEPTNQRLSAFHDPQQKRALEYLFGIIGENAIYVSPNSPVDSLGKALSMVDSTRNFIFISPGRYVEKSSIVWPNINNVQVIGLGDGVTIAGPATDPVITINPTFTTATMEAFLENIEIEHTAQVGLEINNTNMGTRKLLIHLTRVSFSQTSTGDSINVTHTLTTQAIRIYAKACDEIEGLVDIVCANADDRFRFMDGCTLIGGLTVTGAVAGEVTLLNSVILTGGYTTDAANVLTNVACCYRTDAGVYSQLVDAFSA